MNDLATIVVVTAATCGGVGTIGLGALHLTRHRRLGEQLAIATLVPLFSVVATVLLNVQLMFISPHDSLVVIVALITSALLAGTGAWLVMRRLSRASRLLGEGLVQLVSDSAGRPDRHPAGRPEEHVPAPREFSQVLRELAETRQTLAATRRREQAAERSRRELVSFMSHDLRTPLAGLRALAEGLEDGVIDDVPRAMAHLRNTVARMTGLVDDLFALSRVQGPQDAKPRTLISLAELLDDVSAESSATAAARGVRLELELPPNDRLAVLASADDLARALGNLVANAIRHTEPGLAVRIEADRAADGHVRVGFVDGCGGIPEDHLTRVFDTGWRGTPSRTDDGAGAGLGLAIARGVVESHAGQIRVRNVDGGCRFELTLPASASPAVPS